MERLETLSDDPAPPTPPRLAIIAALPGDRREPSPSLDEPMARAIWTAITAPWHPALLARSRALPKLVDVESAHAPGTDEILVVPSPALDQLPSGLRAQAEDAGTPPVAAGDDRAACVHELQVRMDAALRDDADGRALAEDFHTWAPQASGSAT